MLDTGDILTNCDPNRIGAAVRHPEHAVPVRLPEFRCSDDPVIQLDSASRSTQEDPAECSEPHGEVQINDGWPDSEEN